ncbi:Ig-like domain-containing protein [Streptomyces griseofuscus]|uniref:Ig-like domain-containing protein n=1 Tax=Streptomyces griseofuscus TaxID=146922 RepID=UPI001FE773F6|nr:Ig-like domain-containing protein [Streptomyces griseofuscus]
MAVAVAPNGNVYVGNANSANVTEISPLTVTTSPTSPACAQAVTFNISGGDSERDSGGELRGRQPHGHHPLDVIGSGQSTHAYTVGTFTATVNGNPSSVTVSPNPTTTALSVTPNPSARGQSVTVCATITPAPATTSVPTGTVAFTLPKGQTQMVAVSASGQACFTTTALTSGTLTATYSGDNCFTGSTPAPPSP